MPRIKRTTAICEICQKEFHPWSSSKKRFCSHTCTYLSQFRPVEKRFWEKVQKTGPVPANFPLFGNCWLWLGHIDKKSGYGKFGLYCSPNRSRTVSAHAYAYEATHGRVPAGLELDHLCRVRSCVNPFHLEAVTHRQNVLRGNGISAKRALKTHCPKGHP